MKVFRHIVLLLLPLVLMGGCGGRGRIIPKDKMAKIYADMYLADQWIEQNPSVRREADTARVYEPVFERYGYTTEDYLLSAEYYMRDPERYARILKRSADEMDAKLRGLRGEQERIEKYRSMRHPDLWEEIDFMEWLDSALLYAGLKVTEVDSLYRVSWVPCPSDTLFDGPAFTVADTLDAL